MSWETQLPEDIHEFVDAEKALSPAAAGVLEEQYQNHKSLFEAIGGILDAIEHYASRWEGRRVAEELRKLDRTMKSCRLGVDEEWSEAMPAVIQAGEALDLEKRWAPHLRDEWEVHFAMLVFMLLEQGLYHSLLGQSGLSVKDATTSVQTAFARRHYNRTYWRAKPLGGHGANRL